MRPQVRLTSVCFIQERLWLKSACVLEFGGMMALGCCFFDYRLGGRFRC